MSGARSRARFQASGPLAGKGSVYVFVRPYCSRNLLDHLGITLGELVDDIGGGTRSGHPVRAVQVGGPLGAYFRALFDTPFDYEAFTARDGLIGHGSIVVFDDTVDMAKQARFALEFCAVWYNNPATTSASRPHANASSVHAHHNTTHLPISKNLPTQQQPLHARQLTIYRK